MVKFQESLFKVILTRFPFAGRLQSFIARTLRGTDRVRRKSISAYSVSAESISIIMDFFEFHSLENFFSLH